METPKFAMICLTVIALAGVTVGIIFKMGEAIVMGVLGSALTGIGALSNWQPKTEEPGTSRTTSTTTSVEPPLGK